MVANGPRTGSRAALGGGRTAEGQEHRRQQEELAARRRLHRECGLQWSEWFRIENPRKKRTSLKTPKKNCKKTETETRTEKE